jgi:hypothetical protein
MVNKKTLYIIKMMTYNDLGQNQETKMAKNKPTGDGHRIGAVRERSQTVMPSGHHVKRDALTGRFMDVKSDMKPFKGVRLEKKKG